MTEQEAIAELDAIDHTDTEQAHIDADRIVEQCLPEAVAAALYRVKERADGFWYA